MQVPCARVRSWPAHESQLGTVLRRAVSKLAPLPLLHVPPDLLLSQVLIYEQNVFFFWVLTFLVLNTSPVTRSTSLGARNSNMNSKYPRRLPILAAVLLPGVIATPSPQFPGFSSGSNPFSSSGGGSSSSSSSSSSSGNFNFGQNGNSNGGAPFDIDAAMQARAIHGVLAALAMVVLFPSGSIAMRVIPGKYAIWIHAMAQLIAYVVYICAVGLGLYLIREVQIPGQGSLMDNPDTNYHPIIGLVVLVALFIQPILGMIHHAKFKKLRRRQIWSYLHIFNGRIFITLGIANGALGLYMAGESKERKTAYIAVAGVMWGLWMASAVWDEFKRWRASKRALGRGGEPL
ncbi:hypothetical protein V8F20_004769, partial [Naviculisporaceae sp. PSN 640]